MFMGRFCVYIFIGISLVLSTGCQRPQADKTQIQISLPKNMASGNLNSQTAPGTDDKLAHVIVNITGEGISDLMLFQWDSCHDCTNKREISTTLDIPKEIPMGKARLVQVLAVYSNQTTSAMKFYYGDATQDFSKAVEQVPLIINQVGNGSAPIISGRVSGRYFNSATGGPTGEVHMKYNPGNGKPALVVDKDTIVNGWFSFFMLSGANLEYQVVSSGEVLWDGPVSLDSAPFLPVAGNFNYLARAAIPIHIRKEDRNSVVSYLAAEAEYFVWGYWGNSAGQASASGKYVCLDMSVAPTRIYKFSPTAQSTQPLLTNQIFGLPGDTMPSLAQLLDQTGVGSYDKLSIKGGVPMASAPCNGFAPTDLYANYLKVETKNVDGNGGDSVSGFAKVFRLKAGGNAVLIDSSLSPRQIAGQVLPGVELVVDEFRFFKRVGSEDIHMDQPNCYEIAQGLGADISGFVLSGSAPVDANGNFTLTTDISSAEATAGVSGVMCPVKAGIMSSRGVFIQKWSFGGGMTGLAPTVADSYQLSGYFNKIGSGQCHRATLHLKDSALNSGNVTNGAVRTFNISISGVTGVVYSDACLTSAATITMAANEISKDIWYQVSGGTTGQVTAAITGFGPASSNFNIDVATPSSEFKLTLSTDNVKFYSTSECRAIDAFVVDSTDRTTTATASTTINFTVTPTAGDVGFYSDALCSTSVVSLPIGGLFTQRFYIKRLAGSGESQIQVTQGGGGAATAATLYVDPVPLADHVQVLTGFNLLSGAFFGPSECAPLILRALTNTNLAPGGSPGGANLYFGVGATSGSIYTSEGDCNSLTGGQSMIQATITGASWDSPVFWYRNASGGSVQVNVTNPSFRLANPMNNLMYSNAIPAMDLKNISPTPYGWFRMNELLTAPTSSPVSAWPVYSGTMPAFASTGTAPLVAPTMATGSGPWRSLNFVPGSGIAAASMNLAANFSIAFRVRFASTSSAEGVMQIYGTTCNGATLATACTFEKLADGTLRFMGVDSSPGVITDSNFHTISLHRVGSTVELYKDGVQIFTTTVSGAYTDAFATAVSLKFGYTTIDSGTTTTPFTGQLGDIAVWTGDTLASVGAIHNYLMQKNP
jgi:hypothetical protein